MGVSHTCTVLLCCCQEPHLNLGGLQSLCNLSLSESHAGFYDLAICTYLTSLSIDWLGFSPGEAHDSEVKLQHLALWAGNNADY